MGADLAPNAAPISDDPANPRCFYRPEEKSRAVPTGYLTLLLRNANRHAHRHGYSCPSPPPMQHSGGAYHGRPPRLATNS